MGRRARAPTPYNTRRFQLQSDIEALQRAASALGGKKGSTATATRQPQAKRKRRTMSAAARKAVSQRMKAYWAKRKRTRR